MHHLRQHIGVCGIAALAITCSIAGQSAAAAAPDAGLQAYAQAENGSTTKRVTRWTRSRFEAAKKHWAEDQQKFYACSHKLDEVKKTRARRMSFHRQAHFLEKCMKE